MSSSVTFRWNTTAINRIERQFYQGIVRMGTDVASKARRNAPYKTGALENSIRITERSSIIYVIAGGSYGGKTIPYARIHELGGWTGRNHAVYIRPKHYLANSLNEVVRSGIAKYFKGVTK